MLCILLPLIFSCHKMGTSETSASGVKVILFPIYFSLGAAHWQGKVHYARVFARCEMSFSALNDFSPLFFDAVHFYTSVSLIAFFTQRLKIAYFIWRCKSVFSICETDDALRRAVIHDLRCNGCIS
jgi:hypothetical protein